MKVELLDVANIFLDPKNIVGELYSETHMTDKGLERLSIVLERDKKECLYYRLYCVVKTFFIVLPSRKEDIYDLKCSDTEVSIIMADEKERPILFETTRSLEDLKDSKTVDKIIEAVINY